MRSAGNERQNEDSLRTLWHKLSVSQHEADVVREV
jgi:hypothetical protein